MRVELECRTCRSAETTDVPESIGEWTVQHVCQAAGGEPWWRIVPAGLPVSTTVLSTGVGL